MKIDIYNTNKKYKIIYCDPAWHYDFGKSSSRNVNNLYRTDTLQELKEMPIKNLGGKDSVLIMWITYLKLEWLSELLDAWGYKYKTCLFTWIKLNKNNQNIFMGMGYYTRSNAEICIIATKGKPLPRLTHSISQIIITNREEHSKKPAIVREKIVELFGDLPRIELFARQNCDGWDCWGDEV